MTYNPKKHHRKSLRLKGYNYSDNGCYFITIVIQDRRRLLGKIIQGEFFPNEAGQMIVNEWINLKKRFPQILLHAFVVMPDHFHGIIEIRNVYSNDDHENDRKHPRLGEIIGAFKSISTVEYIKGVKRFGWFSFHKRLWQRDYYERIIRNEDAFERISNYIRNNPRNSQS